MLWALWFGVAIRGGEVMAAIGAGTKTLRALALGAATALTVSGCIQLGGGSGQPAAETPTASTTSSSPDTDETPTPITTPRSTPSPSPAPKEWKTLVKETRSGVAHLQVGTCDGTYFGTGFLVDDDLIATASHVIDDANSITVRVDDELISAQVLGKNPKADIALLKLARSSGGYQFSVLETPPELGTEIVVMGFPDSTEVKDAEISDNAFTTNRGSIAAQNQTVEYNTGVTVSNLVRYDASSYPGISGGPLISQDAQVVALVSGGRFSANGSQLSGWSFAAPGPSIAQAVDDWSLRGTYSAMKECSNGPADEWPALEPTINSTHPQAVNIAQSLVAHGQDINAGNYAAAYEIFTPRMQKRVRSEAEWAEGLKTSQWLAWNLVDVTGSGDSLTARVNFTTAQTPEYGHEGQTCSFWDIKYTMLWDGTRWLMDDLKNMSEPIDCSADLEDMTHTDEFGD